MNIAIDIPHGRKETRNTPILMLKKLATKIFPVQKDLKKTLTCDLSQSKKVYKKLLRLSIDKIHDLIDEHEDELHFTKDGQWICFGFDDPMIRNTLMQCDFLKEGNDLDKTKIEKWLKSIHSGNMHHKIAKFSLIKFNEFGKPYLDYDNDTETIVVKKDIKMAGGSYRPILSGRKSFKN